MAPPSIRLMTVAPLYKYLLLRCEICGNWNLYFGYSSLQKTKLSTADNVEPNEPPLIRNKLLQTLIIQRPTWDFLWWSKSSATKRLQSNKCKWRCGRTVLTSEYLGQDKYLFTVYSFQKHAVPVQRPILHTQANGTITYFFSIVFVLCLSISAGGVNYILHLWSVTFGAASNSDCFKCKVPVSAASVPEEPRNGPH